MRYVLALLLCAGRLFAGDDGLHLKGDIDVVKIDKVIVVKEDRTVVRSLPFKVTAPPGAADYRWTVPAGVVFSDLGDTIEITAAAKGEVSLSARRLLIDFDKKTTTFKVDSIIFNVGDVTPPTPPKPPVPDPPKPPAPVPVKGLRVLVVQEDTTGAKLLSIAQSRELNSQAMFDYAKAKFARGLDGTPEFKKVDKDVNIANLNDVWKQFFADWQKNANGSVPWIVVSNGDTGFSGPLPETGILDLIRRYEQ